MTSWIDTWDAEADIDFEAAYDPFHQQSLQPWELAYQMRHNPEKEPVAQPKIPFKLTFKEWHRLDLGLPLRWCENCSEEVDDVVCGICGAKTKRLVA